MILSFLMSLEGKVKKAAKKVKPAPPTQRKNNVDYVDFETRKRITKKEWKKLQAEYKPLRENAPTTTLKEKLYSLPRTALNMARNARDTVIGVPRAAYQNWSTTRHYKKNPNSKKDLVVAIAGWEQGPKNQTNLVKQINKSGKLRGFHLKPYNNVKDDVERAELHKRDIADFCKKTGYKGKIQITGHSDGAKAAYLLATDKEFVDKYHVTHAQMRGPSIRGIPEKDSIGKKALLPFVPADNVNKSTYAREKAVALAKRRLYTKGTVVAGKDDALAMPKDTFIKGADHYLVKGGHFTHSGADPPTNRLVVNDLENHAKGYNSKKKSSKIPVKASNPLEEKQYKKAA